MFVTGSFKMFSNKLINLSKGDNYHFLINLLKWLKFEKMVLTIKNFEICKSNKFNCVEN